MEKRDARLFQPTIDRYERDWNIVEFEPRKQLRQQVNELIRLARHASITTSEMQQRLLLDVAMSGNQLAMQLVRSLNRDELQDRQAIIWLLNLLDNQETIPLLRHMSLNKRLSRSVRFSAALALAGLGATDELRVDADDAPAYAIS